MIETYQRSLTLSNTEASLYNYNKVSDFGKKHLEDPDSLQWIEGQRFLLWVPQLTAERAYQLIKAKDSNLIALFRQVSSWYADKGKDYVAYANTLETIAFYMENGTVRE